MSIRLGFFSRVLGYADRTRGTMKMRPLPHPHGLAGDKISVVRTEQSRPRRNQREGSAVLVFGVHLLNRPEHRFLQLLDLWVGRILADLLQLPVQIK